MGALKKGLLITLSLLILVVFIPRHSDGAVGTPNQGGTSVSPQLKKDLLKKDWLDVSNIGMAPKPPGDLQASSGYKEIVLTWTDNSSDEDGFIIERRWEDQFVPIDLVGPNITTYTDNGSGFLIFPETKYYYRVKAFRGDYQSSASNETDGNYYYLEEPLPARPEGFQGVAQGSSSIKLTWVDKSDNEDGFFIYRKKLGEAYPKSPVIVTGPNIQEYVDSGLEAATWYCYTINPFNGNNQTMALSEIKVRTAPYAPTYFSANRLSDNTVELFWNNRTKVTVINIERKKEGGPWILIKEYIILPPVPSSCYYIDTTAAPGTTYTYRCFAVLLDQSGGPFISEPSNEAKVTTSGASMLNLSDKPSLTSKKVIRFNLGKTDYSVDGQTLTMDTAPVSSEGRTMLPIKYVTDALGATLAWDGQAQKVSIIKGDTTVELWIGQNTARVNGAERLIDSGNPNVRPFIAPPGRTMLPLRFISESLGCTVNWNAELQEASIDY